MSKCNFFLMFSDQDEKIDTTLMPVHHVLSLSQEVISLTQHNDWKRGKTASLAFKYASTNTSSLTYLDINILFIINKIIEFKITELAADVSLTYARFRTLTLDRHKILVGKANSVDIKSQGRLEINFQRCMDVKFW